MFSLHKRLAVRIAWNSLAFLVTLSCVQCTPRNPVAEVENHSFAKPDEVAVTHLDLDLTVDFDRERIHGNVALHIENRTGADKLWLDTDHLHIQRVTRGDDEETATYRLGAEQGYLGSPLIVDIEPDTKLVTVYYETTEGAKALDWLKPSQTAGGKMPFLYSQGQAILNRSWIPCQDTPAIRITYDARVRVPPGMMAVMSARNPTEKKPDGLYEFDMPQPIPPYLIAIAVGDIAFRSLGARSGVYAEPGVVDRAAWEFADTETMIKAAESLYGPYRWERYDMIVLPPSFPYGGMENPRLTFLTPVLLAGDRSLVSTVAHELAHSWSGNLVTNATWSDFWLNEGFTTYFERRIVEAIYGHDAMETEAVLGFADLEEEFSDLGADSPDTRLHNDISGRDPDEGLATTPYEKGYLFLRLIEETVGREKWDRFLREYFDTFAFQTMTSARFVAYLREKLIAGNTDYEAALHIDEWVYEPGLPDNYPRAHSEALDRVNVAVEEWKQGAAATALDTEGWTSRQWKQFLLELPKPQPVGRLQELDKAFEFTTGSNAEVRQVWFLDALAAGDADVDPAIEDYLTSIGRIWLIGGIYKELVKTPEGLAMAKRIFEKARSGYHPLAISYVERVLDGRE
jgi:leukotriene-A4 hydrolase